MFQKEDRTIYKVVVNHEGHYLIRPAREENQSGWSDTGQVGTEEQCLAYIQNALVELRPLWQGRAPDGAANFVKCPFCGLNNTPDEIRCERCGGMLRQPPEKANETERMNYTPSQASGRDYAQSPLTTRPYDSFDSLGMFLTEELERPESSPSQTTRAEEQAARSANDFSTGPAQTIAPPRWEEARPGADLQAFTGEVRMFAGTFAPRGWALCHGQKLRIEENPVLFSVIGTTYGGDGQFTFALPDLRGRAPVGDSTPSHEIYSQELGQRSGGEEVYLAAQDGGRHAKMASTITLNFIICLSGVLPEKA